MKKWAGLAICIAAMTSCGSASSDPAQVSIKAACARVAREMPQPPPEAAAGAWAQFADSLHRLRIEGDAHVGKLVDALQPVAGALASPAGSQAEGADLLRLRARLRAATAEMDAIC